MWADQHVASSFGELLRRFRTSLGITQAELAERAGLSTDAISTLERGVRTRPQRETVRLLADSLQLSIEDRGLLEEAAASSRARSVYRTSLPEPVDRRAEPHKGLRWMRRGRVLIPAVLVLTTFATVAALAHSRTAGSAPLTASRGCIPAYVNFWPGGPSTAPTPDFVGFQRASRALGDRTPRVYTASGLGNLGQVLEDAAAAHPCIAVVSGLLDTSVLTSVAARHPGVRFALVDATAHDSFGFPANLANVESLIVQSQESGYLVGYLAGLMEKYRIGRATRGVIGALGGVPEPQVQSYLDGYRQGAYAALPSIRVLVNYEGAFQDDGTAGRVGEEQIARGADILFGVAGDSSIAYISAAGARGRYGLGADRDQHALGRYVLASAVKRTDVAVYDAVLDAAHHRFRPGVQAFGIAAHATGFGTLSPMVPVRIISALHAEARRLARGSLTVTP